MSGTVKRTVRVAERLREELAALLRGLQDPRLEGVLVSRVEVTEDLQGAKVYLRHALGADTKEARQAMLRGMQAASGRLRREIGKRMGLRAVPTLQFIYDEGPDAERRIEELLQEIKREAGPER